MSQLWRTLFLGSLDHRQGISISQVRHMQAESRGSKRLVLLEQPNQELDSVVFHGWRPACEPGGMLSWISFLSWDALTLRTHPFDYSMSSSGNLIRSQMGVYCIGGSLLA